MDSLPRINAFLEELASSLGWDESYTNRLRLVAEEALSSLLVSEQTGTPRRLNRGHPARCGNGRVGVLAVLAEGNLEDRIACMSEQADLAGEREVSLRLLHHFAGTVHHRKYHGADVVRIEVERP